MSTIFLDLESGNDSNDGLSFANRKKTLAGASAIAQPGDTVKIMASTTPNSLGVNGTFARGSTTITLASAVNATIDNCESAWTGSANVTCATSTTRKQGATSASIAIAAGFTTGLAAYKSFSETDFSNYQQLSFWFQQTSGTLSGFQIKLCSDNAGVTPVSTFTIPSAVVLSGWNRVTIDLGVAMGSSIQSAALYITVDNGAQTFVLDNIVACKAPGTGELSHKTLIGKQKSLGAGGDDSETWYSIRAIEDTTITLDVLNSSIIGSTANGRYWGTSETVVAYSMLPSYVPTTISSPDSYWTSGGTDTQRITISGGWDRTEMSTQTGHTCFGLSCDVPGLSPIWRASFFDMSKLLFVGLPTAISCLGISNTFTVMQFIGCSGPTFSGVSNVFSGLVAGNCVGAVTFAGLDHTVAVTVLSDQCQLNFSSSVGSQITLASNSVLTSQSSAQSNTQSFNGVTYGSLGDTVSIAAIKANTDNLPASPASTGDCITASGVRSAVGLATANLDDQLDALPTSSEIAEAILAGTVDGSVTILKSLEILTALACGKVSASSSGGVTTLTYKKRDGSTTSFTVVVTESDKTRATTGALS